MKKLVMALMLGIAVCAVTAQTAPTKNAGIDFGGRTGIDFGGRTGIDFNG